MNLQEKIDLLLSAKVLSKGYQLKSEEKDILENEYTDSDIENLCEIGVKIGSSGGTACF